MLKESLGKECKVCGRPFTVFKWSPAADKRFKKTEICQTCSKIKNACQSCVLDLEFRILYFYLDVHTRERDETLKVHSSIPLTEVNAQVFVRTEEAKMGDAAIVNQGKAESMIKEVVKRLAAQQSDPYNKRSSKSMVCAFYVKGNCKRGSDCPFLHEMPLKKKTVRKLDGSISLAPKVITGSNGITRYPSQNPSAAGSKITDSNK